MCGIAGKVSPGEPVERELVSRMCDTILHRGPDSEGLHVAGGVGLGMRRLAIIDLVSGDQPIYSEDGRVALVLNGEIYNHEHLREELRARGHRFATGSDVEVVVHLWEEEGPGCVERLRGMFALALWDEGRRELFLARDRVGKKPLYFCHREGRLWFASEPRAILADAAVPRDVDLRAIDAFLVNQYVPHHLCAFRHLRKLPPASRLIWRPGAEPRIERYWRLDYEPKRRISAAEAQERLRELLLEATRIRLMSDVPLGAFLSGGVDSSAVVAAMAMSSPHPVKTFSVAFPDYGADETPHARTVAERYGTDHHELELGRPDPSVLPQLAWQFGEPFADPAALPTFQLSELARREVTVTLNGDGGDESFAGYRRYAQLVRTQPADRIPRALRGALARGLARMAGGTEGRTPLPRAARLGRRLALPPARRYADLFRYFTDADREAVYGPRLREVAARSDPLEHVERSWDAHAGLRGVDRLMAVDLDSYLPDDLLPKVDIASMAWSLEMRSPLLDQELMQFAAGLPRELKAGREGGKLLLRDAVRPWLPDGLLDRRKQGFRVPLAEWLRGELRPMLSDVLLDPVARGRGLFVESEVRRLIEEHQAGRDRTSQLWAMTSLELWYRTCVDASPATPAQLPALS